MEKREIEKFWVGKFEVRKLPFKLESTDRSFSMHYQVIKKVPTSARMFQIRTSNFILSNFVSNFPTQKFSFFPTVLSNNVFLWFWYYLWIYLVIKSETYRSKNSFAFCNQFFFMQQFVIYFVQNVINFTTLTSNGFK